MSLYPIRPKAPADQRWVEEVLTREWGSRLIALHGRMCDAAQLPALIAGERAGLATYELDSDGLAAELVTLNAFSRGQGIGSALLETLTALLANTGAQRLQVSTTNDNLDALRFYQRRGFRLAAVYPGEVDQERERKPSIPLSGAYGIAIHHAIELVRDLV